MPSRIEHKFDDDIEVKRCCSCKQWLHLDMFTKTNRNWDKLQRECKNCKNEQARIRHQKNPKKNRAKLKRYRLRHPDRVKISKDKYRVSEKGKKTEAEYYERKKALGYYSKIQSDYHQRHKNDPEYMERRNKSRRESYYRNKHKHIGKNRERGKQRTKKIKVDCMSGYCNGEVKCQNCGETDIDVLTMDHVYGGGNRLRKEGIERSGSGLHFDLIQKGFPEGYQVLCFNCNHKKSLGSRGKKATDEQIQHYIQ